MIDFSLLGELSLQRHLKIQILKYTHIHTNTMNFNNLTIDLLIAKRVHMLCTVPQKSTLFYYRFQ